MTPRTRKWQRISTGIYRTTYGIRVVMDCAAGRAEAWVDFDTPLDEMKKRRNEMKVELEAAHPELRAGAQGKRTFTAAMKKHLSMLTIATTASRRSELRAFEDAWGPMKIRRVTTDDGKRLVKQWHDAGVAPKTILNRKRALSAMYHDLYGANATTPLNGVSLPALTKRRPKYVPVETIIAVEAALRAAGDAKTHARYLVLTSTGCRPVHLKRALPQDVSLERAAWDIPGAKGGEPIPFPLNRDMVRAFQYFIAADAWGDFDASEYAAAVRTAGWPADVRPYNAKHAVGIDLGKHGIDAETIRDWYGHTDTETTRIYTGVIEAQLKKASQALDGRLGWADILDDNLGRHSETPSNLHIVKGLSTGAEP